MMEILTCGPMVTLQDEGRPGYLSQGLARGGAADRAALAEAAALLGRGGAAIETPMAPLEIRFHTATMIALTGAPMRAELGGQPLSWQAAHPVQAGDVLRLRPGGAGVYAYLSVAGGIDAPRVMGSAATHLVAGIGAALRPGDRLPYTQSQPAAPRRLTQSPERFEGGMLRCVATPQTALFPARDVDRFARTLFHRDPRGNRQGVRLAFDGNGFATEGQLSLMSDFVLPGDVQMTGDGVPYILGPECQTTGGYPRIAHVIAADLPRALQAPVGAPLSFRFVSLEEARAAAPPAPRVVPLVRHPRDMPDLLGYQLVSGVVDAKER